MDCKKISVLVLAALLVGCSSGGRTTNSPEKNITVSISGSATALNANASRIFSATVRNASNTAVTWAVVEVGGGTITQAGVYTAPATPGTYTVKATAQANAAVSAIAPVPVVIPEGSIPGYGVGVDYHAYDADFLHTAFITIYDQPNVRQAVRTQLQAMADRGASTISTRIWFVTEPGTTNFAVKPGAQRSP